MQIKSIPTKYKCSKLTRLNLPLLLYTTEALRRCTFFLEVLSLQLFDLKDCEHLPDSEDENVCVGHRENLLLKQAVENRSEYKHFIDRGLASCKLQHLSFNG